MDGFFNWAKVGVGGDCSDILTMPPLYWRCRVGLTSEPGGCASRDQIFTWMWRGPQGIAEWGGKRWGRGSHRHAGGEDTKWLELRLRDAQVREHTNMRRVRQPPGKGKRGEGRKDREGRRGGGRGRARGQPPLFSPICMYPSCAQSGGGAGPHIFPYAADVLSGSDGRCLIRWMGKGYSLCRSNSADLFKIPMLLTVQILLCLWWAFDPTMCPIRFVEEQRGGLVG